MTSSANHTATDPETSNPQNLHRSVIALGFVSLFMDLSSESIHSLLPLFMVNVLALSALAVGLLDGAAEALTLFIKPVSGWVSDRFTYRKPLTLAGYGIAAFSKPLFALSQGLGLVVFARLLDRVGKGIRGAPRDALIADVTPKALRGRAYGLRQAMDTIGALLGPLLAVLLMWLLHDNYRLVFWIAAVPAVIAVIILWWFVKEPKTVTQKALSATPGELTSVVNNRANTTFSHGYWSIVILAGLIALARPSEAFLLLQGNAQGLSASTTPLLLALMNVLYAASVFPVGLSFDRVGPRKLLMASLLLLAIAMLCLQQATSPAWVYLAAAFWGLHLGCSQGVLSALISLYAPNAKRGTAFGIYALCVGIAYLINGTVMGLLWSPTEAFYAFGFCVLMSLMTLMWFIVVKPHQRQK